MSDSDIPIKSCEEHHRHQRFNPSPTHTLFAKDFAKIAQPVRDLVFGYINECQILFGADQIIPQNAYCECLRYYHDSKTHRNYGEAATRCLILHDTQKREQSLAVLTSDDNGMIRFCQKYLKSKVRCIRSIVDCQSYVVCGRSWTKCG